MNLQQLTLDSCNFFPPKLFLIGTRQEAQEPHVLSPPLLVYGKNDFDMENNIIRMAEQLSKRANAYIRGAVHPQINDQENPLVSSVVFYNIKRE